MLSPHPSYPPLEMAACGGVAVTTTFGSKTAERLNQISPNIIGANPTLNDLVFALATGLAKAQANQNQSSDGPQLPHSWVESLSDVLPVILSELEKDGVSSRSIPIPPPNTVVRLDAVDIDLPGFEPGLFASRFMKRRQEYRPASTPNLLSVITTVYDTEPDYLYDLANSIFGQINALPFEWVILDNGSTSKRTIEALRHISADGRVTTSRAEKNLGIIGGMHWCLENAKGKYVVPVDSDDLLFPDCLSTIQSFLEQTNFPAILYTDEDKTDGLHNREAYIKPEWDPVLFSHACYIAHVTAIKREMAISLSCYSDPQAEGCHDWDTFIRFVTAGHQPKHINDVLYSWRQHQGSTSANIGAKSYVSSSHRRALQRFLDNRKPNSFEILQSPLYPSTPDYRFRFTDGSDVYENIILSDCLDRDAVLAQVDALQPNVAFLLLKTAECREVGSLAAEEAFSLFALFPDTVVVGGRLHDEKNILDAGYIFGFDGLVGCPDRGRAIDDSGYCNLMWKPHSVAGLSGQYCFVQREFFRESLATLPERVGPNFLGPWLGALAREQGKRVIYTPFCEAIFPPNTKLDMNGRERALFAARFGDRSNDCTGYVKGFDLTGTTPFRTAENQPAKPATPYSDFLAGRIEIRASRDGAAERVKSQISLLTTVYERTDVALFRETCRSVAGQTLKPLEWVVLAHGPISRDLSDALRELSEDGSATIWRKSANLGIHGGLRFCLERAAGEFVMPLDADDLLTPDAIRILSDAIAREVEGRIFYSDEDLLVGGVPAHAFYRPDYDPVHLRAHSFIWHSLVFERALALQLGVFTSAECEYALDWDTLLRFEMAGFSPKHVREVLYHWRQHANSLSNSGTINAKSISSVKAALEAIRCSLQNKFDYEVKPYPCDVGMPDYYLARLPTNGPSISLVRIGSKELAEKPAAPYHFGGEYSLSLRRGSDGADALYDIVNSSSDDFLLILGDGGSLLDGDGIWQAIRHFEMVPSVGAVGGPIIKPTGQIVAGGMIEVQAGTIRDPFAGRSFLDRGEFMLSLMKAQCVSALPIDFVLVRRSFILEALEQRPSSVGLRSLSIWLAIFASQLGSRLVYEPLFRGVIKDSSNLAGDEILGLQRALDAHLPSSMSRLSGLCGISGFEQHKLVHPL
jgi:glycosyltransferase involved in cell wall biosynthesis